VFTFVVLSFISDVSNFYLNFQLDVEGNPCSVPCSNPVVMLLLETSCRTRLLLCIEFCLTNNGMHPSVEKCTLSSM
jgi:hypothetical protein